MATGNVKAIGDWFRGTRYLKDDVDELFLLNNQYTPYLLTFKNFESGKTYSITGRTSLRTYDIKEDVQDLFFFDQGEIIDIYLNGVIIKSYTLNTAEDEISILTIQTPKMTSNTQPSGVCSASSELYYGGNTYAAYKAFQQVLNTSVPWHSASGTSGQWIRYQFPTAKVIKRVDTWSPQWGEDVAVKQYKFQGSNDNSNWVDLRVCDCKAIGQNIHEINNNTAYLYYLLRITAGYVSRGVAFACINMYGY